MKWIVAAPGESLTPEIAEQCRGYDCIAVNDAWRLFPFARELYAADADWWRYYKGVPDFAGEKWSTYGVNVKPAEGFGLNLVRGVNGYGMGFSFEPGIIHWCANSGFQGVNRALMRGATRIVLVGFDMRGSHFFGEHPPMPRRFAKPRRFDRWIKHFEKAAELLPAHIRIINATEGSALTCFPMMSLSEALDESGTA